MSPKVDVAPGGAYAAAFKELVALIRDILDPKRRKLMMDSKRIRRMEKALNEAEEIFTLVKEEVLPMVLNTSNPHVYKELMEDLDKKIKRFQKLD